MGYELTFQGPSGQTITKTASGGQTVTVRVEPGLWTVKVRSYDPATGVDEAKGEILSFDVKEGQTNSPIVQMRFVQTAPIAAYLASAGGSPVSLHLDLPLDGAAWGGLLGAIASAGKTVDLNLSACTGSGSGAGLRGDGTFDPDSGVTTGKSYVASLVLPDAATSIANGPTFNGFSALKSISGARITAIGSGSGYSTSLTTISLPEGVTIIGYDAFYNCTSLATISLPAGVTTIDVRAFCNCTSLTTISLPASLTTVGSAAFGYCKSLATISLPASLKTIDGSAFTGCNNLTSINLPATISSISDDNPFTGCPLLLFTVSGTGPLSTIEGGKALVYNTKLISYISATGSVTLPDVTAIGGGAFSGCTSLTNISMPSVNSIERGAFWGCTSLTLTSLPTGVTTIVDQAFSGCRSLTTIDLSNVTSIEGWAFKDCTNLINVTLGNGVSLSNTPFGPPFPGNLDTVYSGAGTYVRDNGDDMTWEKLP
jgi:hypothetical protein